MKHLRTRLCAALLALQLVTGIAVRGQQNGTAILKRLGYPPDARLLILHADDVGMSHSVNVATFQALRQGYVSSASIMVPCPWFLEAAEFARVHPEFDFGLHLTLTSEWHSYRWGPVRLEGVNSLVDAMGYFPNESGAVGGNAIPEEVAAELQAQLQRASAAGIDFSHLDNHMGALSQNADLFKVYLRAARQARKQVLISPQEAKAYAEVIAEQGGDYLAPEGLGPKEGVNPVEWFSRRFANLHPGLYYTIVHLGEDDEELRAIMASDAGGARARAADLRTVSDPAFREALARNHIQLVSWREVARRLAAGSPKGKQQAGGEAQ